MLKVSYLVHYNTLLQNATDFITKCDSYFITECDKILFQNVSDVLPQNTLLQSTSMLLQNATVITKYVDFITKKIYSYYKMRRHSP